MAIEVVGFYRDNESLYNECKKCISYYSVIVLSNGARLEGIIEEVINDSVSILVAEDVMESEYENEMNRQQYMGYRQPGRFMRFNRRRFPMNNINSARVLRFPYTIPPYPVYPYSYPYPYPYYPY